MPDLLCPRCEKPLGADHNQKTCQEKLARGMSRRFFFGVAFGWLAATIAPQSKAKPWQRGVAGQITLDEINAITLAHINPLIADNFFKQSPLLLRLKDADYRAYYSGDSIKEPFLFQDSEEWTG